MHSRRSFLKQRETLTAIDTIRTIAPSLATGPAHALAIGRALIIACMVAAVCSNSVRAAADSTAPSRTRAILRDELVSLAPYLAQIVNLAAWDPALAASLVPEPWIDALLSGAIELETEIAERKTHAPAPVQWPIGAWATPVSLAETIRAIDPTTVAALYRALKPRMSERCRRVGSTAKACERALQTSVVRLSAPEIQTRAIGHRSAVPMTATQIGLSGLGEPVVIAVRDQLTILGRTLWGKRRRAVN